MNYRKLGGTLIVSQMLLILTLATYPVKAATTDAPPAYRLPRPVISETLSIPQKTVQVLGGKMTYLELGKGPPVLFVHGNPTSSYLWRNVMPYVSGSARALAIDLIGMGGSDKPKIDYTFADHYRYLEGFIDALGLDKITLVGHDWGAALSWEYARRHPDKVVRLAFMEGVLPPTFPRPTFESMGEKMGNMFRALKDLKQGHKMVIIDNMFVEQVLPGFVNRTLGDEAMTKYRAPFIHQKDRNPVLSWPREVPIAGQPAANARLMNKINTFMGNTKMPVLLAYADPGVLIPPQATGWYKGKISNLETAFVGQGFHFIQEDQPAAIGRAIADWLRRN